MIKSKISYTHTVPEERDDDLSFLRNKNKVNIGTMIVVNL